MEFSKFMKTQSERTIDYEEINDLYNKYSKSSFNSQTEGI